MYSQKMGITVTASDELFPAIAINYLGPVAGLVFIIGLISAAFPSADGALTSLTTSVSIDFLGLDKRKDPDPGKVTRIRYGVHLTVALVFFISILLFSALNNKAVIDELFTIAGYTYGPLLGLFSFGLFTKRRANDRMTPWIAIISPLLCILLNTFSEELLGGYNFGFEMILVNGFLTFAGLWFFSRKQQLIG